jgi:anti-sigma B factor antagonist
MNYLRKDTFVEKFVVEKKGNVVVMSIIGDIEFDDSITVNEKFVDVIKDSGSKIVLNLKECAYVDSSGLGSLVEGLKGTQKEKGDLRLCNLSVDFKEVLMMTRTIKYFQVFESVDKAVESFNEGN